MESINESNVAIGAPRVDSKATADMEHRATWTAASAQQHLPVDIAKSHSLNANPERNSIASQALSSRVDLSRHHMIAHKDAGMVQGTSTRRFSGAAIPLAVSANNTRRVSIGQQGGGSPPKSGGGGASVSGEGGGEASLTIKVAPKPKPKVDKVRRALGGTLQRQFTKSIVLEDEKQEAKLRQSMTDGLAMAMKQAQLDSADVNPFAGESSGLQAAAGVGVENNTEVMAKAEVGEKEWNPWPFSMEITQEDRDQFYMWTNNNRKFLVLFITKWRNQCLNTKREIESRAWMMWKEHNRIVDIARHKAWVEKTAIEADLILQRRAVTNRRTHKRRGSVVDIRTNEQVETVTHWLRNFHSDLLESLNDDEMRDMATHAIVRHYNANDMLFLQGWEGDEFYILLEGKLRLFTHSDEFRKLNIMQAHTKQKVAERAKSGEKIDYLGGYLGNFIVDLHEGSGFGELAFISDHKFRSASAAWLSPAKVLVINEALYNKTLHKHHRGQYELNEKKNMIQSIKLFANWKDSQILTICAVIKKVEYAPGHVIGAQGDTINDVVMITGGEVLMSKRVTVTTNTIPPEVKEVSVEVARCGAGTLLGDIEIIRNRDKYMETSVCTGVVTGCVVRCGPPARYRADRRPSRHLNRHLNRRSELPSFLGLFPNLHTRHLNSPPPPRSASLRSPQRQEFRQVNIARATKARLVRQLG